MDKNSPGICRRLAKVREKHYGPRGKARFARELGIRPSTYHHYEEDRTPPADLLVLAARITGTDLVWILTGDGSMEAAPTSSKATIPSEAVQSELERLIDRLRQLAAQQPHIVAGMHAMLNLLESMTADRPQEEFSLLHREPAVGELIPIVGGTAAGPARFWEELAESEGGPEADARLEQLLEDCQQQNVRAAQLHEFVSSDEDRQQVALVQLSHPDELGVVEFLSCPRLRHRYPNAVAWRIDGESMAPRYADGDFVITSPDVPARHGSPCVARQRGQIGVNCKIFHSDPVTGNVFLIPVNEAYSVQRVEAADLMWAYQVLFSVRLHSSTGN